jgi:hypothetical protein
MDKNYVIAIPTYNRPNEVIYKTLHTLKEGNVNSSRIYLFVANREQFSLYESTVPKELYHKIIIGKKGIANQRNIIANYFEEGRYVVSLDDDVEEFQILKNEKLVKLKNIDLFFRKAYELLKKENLFIWGIYPVRNAFFMYDNITTDLRFIIGVSFGFITRHDKRLKPSIKSETKEDYEQTVLYYKMDGGVMRFNNITTKTKFNAPGGLGTERFERNKTAAEYLTKKYPYMIVRNDRKDGTPEVKLIKLPRII